MLLGVSAWAGPALDGTYSGHELGQLQLSTSPSGEVTGRAKRGGACSFKPDTPVLSGTWQGDVLVGHLTVCLSGTKCPDEKKVPFLALWHQGSLVGDVKLSPGCSSPALPDRRLELTPAGADEKPGHGQSAEQLAKRTMTEREREAYLSKLLASGVESLNNHEWRQAKRTFESAMEDGADNSLTNMGLGVALVRLGDSQKGIETLARAAQLAKAEKNTAVLGQSYFNLACAWATLGKQPEALNNLKLAARYTPAKELETALDQEHDLDTLKDSSEYRAFSANVHLDAAKTPRKRGAP